MAQDSTERDNPDSVAIDSGDAKSAQTRGAALWGPWLVIAWTLAITVWRGLRLPNDFSEAHWLLDYRFGFTKRGFMGAITSLVSSVTGIPVGPALIQFMAGCTTVLLYGAFLVLAYRILRKSQDTAGVQLALLAFASSPFLVMSGHLFGYQDAAFYFLAIVSVAFLLSGRPLWSMAVSIVGLLVHESYLLAGLPLVAVAAAYTATRPGTAPVPKSRYAAALLAPVGFFLCIVVSQALFVDQAAFREQLTAHLTQYDFIATRASSVARWHTTSLFDCLGQQRGYFVRRLLEPKYLAAIGPTLLTLILFGHLAGRLRPYSRLSLLLLAAVLCPLSLHAVAWDTARIWTYVIGGAFIAGWIAAETRGPGNTRGLVGLVALPALVYNVFSRYYLMDNEVERFENSLRAFMYLPALLLAVYAAARPQRD